MKKNLNINYILMLTLVLTGCITDYKILAHDYDKVLEQFTTGVKVDTNSKPLQLIIDNFEQVPGNGPTANQTVEIYDLQNSQCLALVKMYNESGFGGYEGLIIFSDNNLIISLQRDIIYTKEHGSPSESNTKYGNIDDSERTKKILKDDFSRYMQKFNSKVLTTCR